MTVVAEKRKPRGRCYCRIQPHGRALSLILSTTLAFHSSGLDAQIFQRCGQIEFSDEFVVLCVTVGHHGRERCVCWHFSR